MLYPLAHTFTRASGAELTTSLRTRLQEVEALWRALFEASPIGITVLDLKGHVREWNQAAERTFGWRRDEVVGQPLPIIPQGKESEHRALRERVLRDEAFTDLEVIRRRRDGTDVDISLSTAALRDESGRVVGILGLMADISERKRAEQAVRRSEEQFRQVAEHIREVFWLVDADMRETFYVSPAYDEIWGRSRTALYTAPWSWLDAVHPADRERVEESAVRQTEGAYDEEYRIVRPDGTIRWIRDRAFPVLDAQGRCYRVAGIAEDITDRKEAEHVVKALVSKLVSVHEDERRRLARELHDGIGQSLTSILVGLRTLSDIEPALIDEHVRVLRQLTSDALREVQQLARGLRPAALDDLGLEAALRRYAADYRAVHGVAVDVVVTGGSGRLPATIETELYRITQEALTNVARHAAARSVSVVLKRTDDSVQLIVEDDGRGGCADPVQAPSSGSAHLGLCSMRERAALLRGSLAVESVAGRGTTIFVTIPLLEAAAS
ncbi:MAG TPA: PAS domain S-box protein [Nitrospirales bacterium]|nr:PAS domain S-box protein [Nitrospirales bacterium]